MPPRSWADRLSQSPLAWFAFALGFRLWRLTDLELCHSHHPAFSQWVFVHQLRMVKQAFVDLSYLTGDGRKQI